MLVIKAIYKYSPSDTSDHAILRYTLPKGAEITHIGWQDNAPRIWALVNTTDNPTDVVEVDLTIVGTGWPLDQEFTEVWEPLTTEQVGSFVWHVFCKRADYHKLVSGEAV